MDEFPGIIDRINLRFNVTGGHFGCGFNSMDQLRNWFSKKEIDKVRQLSNSIVQIKADEVLAQSDNQLVFWCKKAAPQCRKTTATRTQTALL